MHDNLLLYRLNRYCPEKGNLKKTTKLDSAEKERFFRDLEKRISGEMEDLVTKKDGKSSLSPSAPVNIVSYVRESAEYLGLLDFSIDRLVHLKQKMISHQQDLLFRLVRSYLNVLPVAFRGMLAEEDTDRAFMMDPSSGWPDERKHFMSVFKESLGERCLYDLEGCMDLDDPEVARMIDSTGVPDGKYQLRMPYQVLMLNDLSVISERRKKKDVRGTSMPVIELYEKRDDAGIHDQFSEFVDSQPYSRMVCREALEGMVRGKHGRGK